MATDPNSELKQSDRYIRISEKSHYPVISHTLLGPPGGESKGDKYAMPTGTLTGAWSGYAEGDIATYTGNSTWDKVTPLESHIMTSNAASGEIFVFDGTSFDDVAGGSGPNIVSNPTTPYAAQNNDIIVWDATAGNKVVNFPAAGASTDFVITVIKTDSTLNSVTNDGNGDVMVTQNESIAYTSDGSTWRRTSNRPDGQIFKNDQLVETKLDVGKPGAAGGVDVGEGGSYQTDGIGGAVIVYAYSYDASAGTGSRFTSLDINAQNTLLGDVGDRLYIGSIYPFWGLRTEVGVAKVGGTQILKYSNAGALTSITAEGGMIILKDSAETVGNTWLEQIVEKEYIVQDRDIDPTWTTEDDITDVIPNTGTPLYWMVYEVPSGGWSTPPRVDEIKVRGSDFDIISGAAFSVSWGKARVENHERIDLGEGSGPTSSTLNITSTQDFEVKRMRSANPDPITRLIQLPEGIDTSCGVYFTLDYSASTAINTADIVINIKKLKNATAIGSGETSDFIETDNINVLAGDTFYTDSLLDVNLLDISDLIAGDDLSVELSRSDSNGGDFYPMTLSFHYVIWTGGEHV